jgi:hypothetical protein
MTKFSLLSIRIITIIVFSLLFCINLKAQSNPEVNDSTSLLDKSSYYVVDTTVHGDLVKSLIGFLQAKNAGSLNNPYIHPDYLEEDAEPFQHFLNNEYQEPDGSYLFKARVLRLLPVATDTWLIKLIWLGTRKESRGAYFDRLGGLIVKRIGAKYYFYNMENYATRNWGKRQVGSIEYIFPHSLNLKKAKEMHKISTRIAKRFNQPVTNVKYYKCEDPVQIFRILGLDYTDEMYISTVGGLAKYWNNTIYAGNNSEMYAHEFIHVYSRKAFPNSLKVVDEGYATYFGGSGGFTLDQLKTKAKQYLAAHPDVDITANALNFEETIPEGASLTYIFGGLVCRDIETKLGFDGIKKLYELTDEQDYFDRLKEIIGVDKANYADYINRLLE